MEDGQPKDNRHTGQNFAHKAVGVGEGRGPNENVGATNSKTYNLKGGCQGPLSLSLLSLSL